VKHEINWWLKFSNFKSCTEEAADLESFIGNSFVKRKGADSLVVRLRSVVGTFLLTLTKKGCRAVKIGKLMAQSHLNKP